MGDGTTRIDSGQIRSAANQFNDEATQDLAKAIGELRTELAATSSMFGSMWDDYPSRHFETAYRPHESKMLNIAEALVRGLQEVSNGLTKMANDFDQADSNATVT